MEIVKNKTHFYKWAFVTSENAKFYILAEGELKLEFVEIN